MLVANARMYSVGPATAAAWRTLVGWVADAAAVPMEIVEHTGPIDALWRRADLGCALMCGYPFATWDRSLGPRPLPLAAPAPRASGARPRYRSCIVVRADSAIESLDDLRGSRFAYTIGHSQSGCQAARRLFAERALRNGGRYFERVAGPLHTPRRIVEAVVDDEVDAGPLDSYWLDLLSRHEPQLAQKVRVIATTPWTPMPLLVCSATVAADLRARIVRALLAAATAGELEHARDTLALHGFAPADARTYAVLADDAAHIDALGYPTLQ
jgi:ABC-type phosphate/phosphonate transport system substrate-binding protein